MDGRHEDDPAAVGAPGGVFSTGGNGREPHGGATGRRNNVQLQGAGAVGLEENRLPVGRPARSGVLRRPVGDRQGARRGRTVGRGDPQACGTAIGLWVDRRHLPDNLRAVGGDLRIGDPQKPEQVLDLHRAPSHSLGSPRDRAGGREERADDESHEAGQTVTHGGLRKLEDGPATRIEHRIQPSTGAAPQDNAPRPRPGIVRSGPPPRHRWDCTAFSHVKAQLMV